MDLIDIDDDQIDAEILDSMYVTNEHFKFAQGSSNPISGPTDDRGPFAMPGTLPSGTS